MWVWGDEGPCASMARVCCLLGFQLGEGDAGLVGLHCHAVITRTQIHSCMVPAKARPPQAKPHL